MEKGDIDLRQINSMVSWKLLRPAEFLGWTRNIRRLFSNEKSIPTQKSKACSIYWYHVAFILFLMWPAALGGPLLPGSVHWIPRSIPLVPDSGIDMTSKSLSQNTTLLAWELCLEDPEVRNELARRAFQNYIMIALSDTPLQTDHWRHIVVPQLGVRSTKSLTRVSRLEMQCYNHVPNINSQPHLNWWAAATLALPQRVAVSSR